MESYMFSSCFMVVGQGKLYFLWWRVKKSEVFNVLSVVGERKAHVFSVLLVEDKEKLPVQCAVWWWVRETTYSPVCCMAKG
jgi:hypothetical protein